MKISSKVLSIVTSSLYGKSTKVTFLVELNWCLFLMKIGGVFFRAAQLEILFKES